MTTATQNGYTEQYRCRSLMLAGLFKPSTENNTRCSPSDISRLNNCKMPENAKFSYETEDNPEAAEDKLKKFWEDTFFKKITSGAQEIASLQKLFARYFTQGELFGALSFQLQTAAKENGYLAACRSSYEFTIENGIIIFEERVNVTMLSTIDSTKVTKSENGTLTEATCRWAISLKPTEYSPHRKADCCLTDVVIEHKHKISKKIFDQRSIFERIRAWFKKHMAKNKLKSITELDPAHEEPKYHLAQP